MEGLIFEKRFLISLSDYLHLKKYYNSESFFVEELYLKKEEKEQFILQALTSSSGNTTYFMKQLRQVYDQDVFINQELPEKSYFWHRNHTYFRGVDVKKRVDVFSLEEQKISLEMLQFSSVAIAMQPYAVISITSPKPIDNLPKLPNVTLQSAITKEVICHLLEERNRMLFAEIKALFPSIKLGEMHTLMNEAISPPEEGSEWVKSQVKNYMG